MRWSRFEVAISADCLHLYWEHDVQLLDSPRDTYTTANISTRIVLLIAVV